MVLVAGRLMLFTARTYAAETSKTKGGAVITLGNNATYYSTVPRWDDDFN